MKNIEIIRSRRIELPKGILFCTSIGITLLILSIITLIAEQFSILMFCIGVALLIVAIPVWVKYVKNYRNLIVVKQGKVYGHSKNQDFLIPIDNITSVRIENKDIIISYNESDVVSIYLTGKHEEIRKTILKLIISSNEKTNVEKNAKEPLIPADELISLKKLLEAGIITEEEFETKKQQLLSL